MRWDDEIKLKMLYGCLYDELKSVSSLSTCGLIYLLKCFPTAWTSVDRKLRFEFENGFESGQNCEAKRVCFDFIARFYSRACLATVNCNVELILAFSSV